MLIVEQLRKDFHQLQIQQKTLLNNEINDIIKVIRSLENRGIVLKGAKTVVKLIKIHFCTIMINDSNIGSRCSFSKENFWIRNNNIKQHERS